MAKESPREIWSVEEEKYFFERYSHAGANKQDILLSQAFCLLLYNVQKDNYVFDAILRILGKFFLDFPDDKTHMAPALHIKAKVCDALGRSDEAFEYYKKAAEAEAGSPETVVGAWLDYAKLIVMAERSELYGEAERYVVAQYDKLGLSFDGYDANTILAVLAGRRGDKEKQRHYQGHADAILEEVRNINKKIRYVSAIKIKDANSELKEKIRVFMLEKGFEIVLTDDGPVWQKKGFLCLHNAIVYCAFDVVIIIAHISFFDAGRGNVESGLDGFTSATGKKPLKKIIKELEELIEKS